MIDISDFPVDYERTGDGIGKPIYDAKTAWVRVQFIRHWEVNPTKSLKSGKEILEEKIVLLKRAAKDSSIVANKATEEDKRIYSDAWKRFQAGEKGELGFPIERLYGVTPKQAQMLHHFGVFTIEDLLSANQEVIDSVEDGEKIKALAKVWSNQRKSDAEEASAIELVEVYRERSESYENELAKLRAEVLALKRKDSTELSLENLI